MPIRDEHVKSSAKGHELRNRLLTAAALAPLAGLFIYIGGMTFALFAMAAGIVIGWEWTSLVFGGNRMRHFPIVCLAVVACGFLTFQGALQWAGTVMVLAMAAAFLASPRSKRLWAASGVVYATAPVAAFVMLRADMEYGRAGVFFLVLCVLACDTAAFCAGKGLGGAKLAPRISPAKTWAGFFGGILAGAGVGALFGAYLTAAGPVPLALFGAFLAAISQAGDLLESAIKRFFKVKDSGNLLPGHGGVMDRFDALIAASLAGCLAGVVKLGPDFAAKGMLVW